MKLNSKGFGIVGILVGLIVIILIGGTGYYVWTSKYGSPDRKIKNWLTINQVQSKLEAIKQDGINASDAAKANDAPKMLTACKQFSSDIKTAQNIPPGPDTKLNDQLAESLTTMSGGAEHCVDAIKTNDINLLTSSGQETLKGIEQLKTFVDNAKPFLN